MAHVDLAPDGATIIPDAAPIPDGGCEVSGAPGACISTTDCAAMASHTSYAGLLSRPRVDRMLHRHTEHQQLFAAALRLGALHGQGVGGHDGVGGDDLNDPTHYPMFSTTTKTFGAQLLLARVEWHPPDFQNGIVHRGVTLYQQVPMTPTLETERLLLRRHQVGDYAECVAMWSDPRVVAHIGGKPFTAQETWTKLLRYVGHWALLGFGYWVMIERDSGRFVGELGFADFSGDRRRRSTGHPKRDGCWRHGRTVRGDATEALSRVLAWGDAHFAAPTVCLIDPGNVASIAVAQKVWLSRGAAHDLLRSATDSISPVAS